MSDSKSLNEDGHTCDFSRIVVGERLSVVNYYEVMRKNDDKIQVQDPSGFEFSISKNIVEKENYSARQFSREEVVTRTELIQKFMVYFFSFLIPS